MPQSSLNVSANLSKDAPTLPKANNIPLATQPILSLIPSRPITHTTPRRSQKKFTTKTWKLSEIPGAALKLLYLKRSSAQSLPPAFSPLVQTFNPAPALICYASIPSHPIPRRRGIPNGVEARCEVCERPSTCSA